MAKKTYVFSFQKGDGKNKMLLGGKGANLCEMTQIGLPVPPGFVISTEACVEYLEGGNKVPRGLMEQINSHMTELEKKTGKGFGNPANPLLVSVRSGAALSMPGMMDTILNLGLNDQTAAGLLKLTKDERFVYDAYRRLLSLFGKIALDVEEKLFDDVLEAEKKRKKVKLDTELTAESWKSIVDEYKRIIKRQTRKPFPQDPLVQLQMAVEAVFRSWNIKRAVDYRRQFNITKEMAYGTAVSVCTMVFGNMGDDCATGVGFTRDPGTGENRLYGEYLINAQGEDVVAGIRTPKPIKELRKDMPEVYRELLRIRQVLENHYREVQDFEFTIEKGKLYMLQTRNGKMNAQALVKTSNDMVNEGLITEQEAVMRIAPEALEQLLHPRLDPKKVPESLADGIAASPGAASGQIAFSADDAVDMEKQGRRVILVREETKPDDIHGFFASVGILTSRGGKTSHAAVVARGMGKPCVSGAENIHIDYGNKKLTMGGATFGEGDVITIDGSTGSVYAGEVPTIEPEMTEDLLAILEWADEIRTLGVWANADTPEAAAKARQLGAEGIGLCRTERMFNAQDRLPIFQEMILADNHKERQKAIDQLVPMQKEDFKAIFKEMNGLPVIIRLLDPPLHEFLPTVEELMVDIKRLREFSMFMSSIQELPETMKMLDHKLSQYLPAMDTVLKDLAEIREKGIDTELLKRKEETLSKVRSLTEVNPMLGHRGVRLGISNPEIYDMQIQAILEAAAECIADGVDVHPEIMVPQVCTAQELRWVHQRVTRIYKRVERTHKLKVKFRFGTMIEVVRACMRAGRLAEVAEFFSFGTNDLTQGTFSFSREDAENKFLPLYNERLILQDNPFEILDVKGVGRLISITIEWARKTRPDIEIGICGEHGGNPRSIEFCHQVGMNYVSCSPPRVPVARLAAAHARLKELAGSELQEALAKQL
ncbi:MAG: pyruvate, phosphate dikinase [Deltaproteobacteria bacterium]|nr:pyruvate, phosphate dikinase [Deltaproteobacteria bacterium]MBW2072379.1 pyruvate, phosphate dikinase [Deltaproteobacteria bacterium]